MKEVGRIISSKGCPDFVALQVRGPALRASWHCSAFTPSHGKVLLLYGLLTCYVVRREAQIQHLPGRSSALQLLHLPLELRSCPSDSHASTACFHRR